MKKPSLGRQKIAIAKISKKNHLQVTFSKRKSGLFKKASELCTLCGVEVAIIVFSPANKPFSFGHPDVDVVIDRFLVNNQHHAEALDGCNFANDNFNGHIEHALKQLEFERKRGEEHDLMRKINQIENWWEAPIEEFGLQELQQLKLALEELRVNVRRHLEISSIQLLEDPLSCSTTGDIDHLENKAININRTSASHIWDMYNQFGLVL